MDRLIASARTQSTDTILICLATLGGGFLDKAARMARAALIEVYIEREGAAAGDRLMDEMGL